ncbi:hypothetical protein [Natronorubrum sp. A-ect3]|uniref:hypothetical protein n=1 Tax=Natronorubrum sp. A-ect3 TaxID=3242698 RepID=UPI00359D196F
MSDETADSGEGFDALLEEASACLENVEECLGGVEQIDDLDDETLESVLGDVETLTTVVRETEELIDAIDFSDLPAAVDGPELLEALEVGTVPEVLTDEETGASELVDFTQLFRAIDLLSAWDATDLRELWSETRELEAAVDDLGDEGEDASMVETAANAVTDESSDLIGEDGMVGGDEDGLVGGEDDLLEDADPMDALGDIDVENDPEAYQVAIQQQAMKGIDAFRTALLETHEQFEQLYEFNREKMRRQDTSANSRNPTAASTIPTDRRDLGGGARHATVPQDVRLSTAPSRKRIYGRRFEIEREKQRSPND